MEADERYALKTRIGSTAFFVFVVTGAILHISRFGFTSLVSIRAVAFFLCGMFAVPIVAGLAAYALHRLIQIVGGHNSASWITAAIVSFAATVGGTIYVTSLGFNWLYR